MNAPTERTPRNQAIALAYNEGDLAPRVVARGDGPIAEEIVRRAREAGVFVHESTDLVRLLAKVELDSHIPPQLYLAIAEILAWVYRLERNEIAPTTARPAAIPISHPLSQKNPLTPPGKTP